MSEPLSIHAVTPLGMEATAAAELRELGFAVGRVAPDEGRVEWRGTLEDLQRAHLLARSIERMWVEAGRLRAHHFAEFRRKAALLEWERWIDPERPLLLRTTSRASKLYHERALAERLHGAIADRLGHEPPLAVAKDLDDPDEGVQLVMARMFHDECELRVDASGARLHRRGYRLATAKAPLRETLAAAVLAWSGWRAGISLVDPFCGSGTFVLEAARWSAGIAPGADRRFAFESWPGFDATAWGNERERVLRELEPVEDGSILGSDRDEGAIVAARENAVRAGVSTRVRLSVGSVSELETPPGPAGFVVTNPPYGRRVQGGADLRDLFARFGDVLRERFAGWRVVALAGHPQFARASGLNWRSGPVVNNGGQRVPLLRANVPPG